MDASPLEAMVQLGALIRAFTVLCPGPAHQRAGPDVASWATTGQPEPDAEEIRRGERCDLSNRRAFVRVAWVRLEIDEAGKLYSVWHGVQP
ncbi:MAG: hypothetical protein ACRDT6_27700 [Micromonosporaceae bacterium]